MIRKRLEYIERNSLPPDYKAKVRQLYALLSQSDQDVRRKKFTAT